MKRILRIFAPIILIFASSLFGPAPRFAWPSSSDRANVLWYRQPAANWNEALPIGNGRLGAMIFGGVQSERIQLNEDTVWAGEKRDRVNPESRGPEGARNLAEVRR